MSGNERNGLHLTDMTREALGSQVIEGLTASAPPEQAVVIVGPDDFDAVENSAPLPREALSDIFTRVGIDPANGPGLATTMTMGLETAKPVEEGGFAAVTDGTLNDPAAYSQSGASEEAIQEFVNGPGRLPDDTCVVALRTDESARQMFSHTYGGAEPPGTEQDWQLYMGRHELDHCENTSGKFHEYRSDAAANSQYPQDIAEGRATDPELPHYVRDTRATQTMLGTGGENYVTGGLAPLAGERPLTDQQLSVAEGQIQEASMLPRLSMLERGVELPEPDDPLYGQLIYEETRHLLQRGDFDDLPYGKVVAERFVDGAQRYGQEHFNVAPEDAINTPPEMTRQVVPGYSDPAARQGYGMGMSPG